MLQLLLHVVRLNAGQTRPGDVYTSARGANLRKHFHDKTRRRRGHLREFYLRDSWWKHWWTIMFSSYIGISIDRRSSNWNVRVEPNRWTAVVSNDFSRTDLSSVARSYRYSNYTNSKSICIIQFRIFETLNVRVCTSAMVPCNSYRECTVYAPLLQSEFN